MRTTDGKYVATRLMKQTMTELSAIADTKTEARQKLKEEVKRYREGLQRRTPDTIQGTGETIRSPGYAFYRTDAGSIQMRYDNDREVEVVARPAIAQYVKGGRKDNLLKQPT